MTLNVLSRNFEYGSSVFFAAIKPYSVHKICQLELFHTAPGKSPGPFSSCSQMTWLVPLGISTLSFYDTQVYKHVLFDPALISSSQLRQVIMTLLIWTKNTIIPITDKIKDARYNGATAAPGPLASILQ
jgi:hypothetical protein